MDKINNYYCSIVSDTDDDKILYFELYDNNKGLLYNGSFLIIDSIKEGRTLNDFKVNKTLFFRINRKKFKLFLKLDFNNLIEMSINDFLIKYGLEEYEI